MLGEVSARGRPVDAYYFRTSDQYEIDLVLDFGRERWAVEIKLTTAPTAEDMARLDMAADLIKASWRFLVSQVRQASGNTHRASCDLPAFLDRLRDELG